MTYDPHNLREPKKKRSSTLKTSLLTLALVVLCVGVAVIGVVVGDFAEKKSINYRTDASTEIHKVLGDVYAHNGDGQKITRAAVGQLLFIHNKYIKTETCHGFTSNVFWDHESHVVHHYSMFTNWFAEGTYEADEMFVIPEYLPAGKYHIVKKTVSFCSGKEHYTLNYDILIEFYKPSASASGKHSPAQN